jgi:hypothetical protein
MSVNAIDQRHDESPSSNGDGGVYESPLMPLVGLFVVWVTLLLLTWAHTLSDTYIQVGAPSRSRMETDRQLLPLANPYDKLMLPTSISSWKLSPRQALSLMAEIPGFVVQPGDAADIDDRIQRIHLEDVSLGQAIHRLLGDAELGYGVRGRQLTVFRQRIAIDPADDDGGGRLPRRLEWEAELPISSLPMMISPTESTDLRLSLYLRNNGVQAGRVSQWVAVEIWSGPFCLSMTQVEMDEEGKGSINLSNSEFQTRLDLRRERPASGERPGLYRVRLDFDASGHDPNAIEGLQETETELPEAIAKPEP